MCFAVIAFATNIVETVCAPVAACVAACGPNCERGSGQRGRKGGICNKRRRCLFAGLLLRPARTINNRNVSTIFNGSSRAVRAHGKVCFVTGPCCRTAILVDFACAGCTAGCGSTLVQNAGCSSRQGALLRKTKSGGGGRGARAMRSCEHNDQARLSSLCACVF